jgi:hypothetical protein
LPFSSCVNRTKEIIQVAVYSCRKKEKKRNKQNAIVSLLISPSRSFFLSSSKKKEGEKNFSRKKNKQTSFLFNFPFVSFFSLSFYRDERKKRRVKQGEKKRK